MRNLIFIFFVLLSLNKVSAQPETQWSSVKNSGFSFYIYDNPKIKIDNSGDIILVGHIKNSSGKDILIIKYSLSGNILWQKTFNSIYDKDDTAIEFNMDDQDNILIAGYSVIDSLNTESIVIKYNAAGDYKWTNKYSGVADMADGVKAIAIDKSGSTFVTGYSSIDTLGFQKLIIYKVDSSGNTAWDYFYGTDTTAIYHGERIIVIDNNVQVLGSKVNRTFVSNSFIVLKLDSLGKDLYTIETIVQQPGSSYHLDTFGNSFIGYGVWEHFKVIKINDFGTIVWSDTIGTFMPYNTTGDEVKAIITDSLQNVYITGRHYGGDFGGSSYTNADIVTVKYAPNGNRLWMKRYVYEGNNAADIGNDLAIDKYLNVYVAGQSQRDVGNDYDYVVIKYDLNGNHLGSIRYNDLSNGDDVITSIVVSNDTSIYVTGVTFDNAVSSTTTQKYSSVTNVGINDSDTKNHLLKCYPNPFTTTINVEFNNHLNSLFNVQLKDIFGRILYENHTSSSLIEIPGSNLSAGIYILNLKSNTDSYNGIVIKK